MERDSFIFYRSFYEAIEQADKNTQVEVYTAICKKALYDKDIELTGVANIIYTLIKPQLEANSKRYADGKKGGRPKKETTGYKNEKTTGYENKKPNNNVNVNVNENVNDNVNNNIATSEDKSSTVDAKASKHKYGKYKHVLLKDEELHNLQKDYSNWEELIEYLDEYIEMKGYKAKSHYLAIKKWVVDAVKERQNKKQPAKQFQNYNQREYKDLSNLYAN